MGSDRREVEGTAFKSMLRGSLASRSSFPPLHDTDFVSGTSANENFMFTSSRTSVHVFEHDLHCHIAMNWREGGWAMKTCRLLSTCRNCEQKWFRSDTHRHDEIPVISESIVTFPT